MNILEKRSSNGKKIYFHWDMGRGPGQRPSTGIWIYSQPKDQTQKNFNKEALKILEVKKSQRIIEQQAIGTPVIPAHKFKANFLDYYQEYVNKHQRKGNRHLSNSLSKLKEFIEGDFLAPIDITETFCKSFIRYLLDNYNGETPGNYFSRFKWVMKAATKDGYYQDNPCENVTSTNNPSARLKDHLEAEEYIALLNTPCTNQQVRNAFIFCCYTGLRWVDVKRLQWKDLKNGTLTTRIIQKKTGKPVVLTLHRVALGMLALMRQIAFNKCSPNDKVFDLPSANGANGVLEEWVEKAGIDKHITWSCARLSFSILLKDKNVDDATIAYLMGHTTTRQVQKTYKRHKPKDQSLAIGNLPEFDIDSILGVLEDEVPKHNSATVPCEFGVQVLKLEIR